MASTYSPSLRLELMATGDQSGTWGDTTNTNLGTLLEQAITGYLSKAMADANQTLTNLNGASDEARNMIVEATGALTAGRNIVVPTAEKLYLIKNSTTGGFAVTVKTSAGTGVAVPMGGAIWVYCDGTNVVNGNNYTDGLTSGVVFTDAGATAGPVFDLFRDSSSPATNDILGRAVFNGKDSAGNKQEYASIEAIVADATSTSEDGDLDMYATVAGTRRKLFSINSTQALYGRPLPTLANDTTDPTNDISFSTGVSNDLSLTAKGLMWVACAAMIKRLDANWAAGTNQGMRYSGAAIANTTYHLWSAWTDAGAQDYYADPSADQATVLGHLQAETGGGTYTHLRRIGSIIRSAGAIVRFYQNGDHFVTDDTTIEYNATTARAMAALTLTGVPAGISVRPILTARNLMVTVGDVLTYVAPTLTSVVQLVARTQAANGSDVNTFDFISTTTNREIFFQVSILGGTVSVVLNSKGWIDSRGKNG